MADITVTISDHTKPARSIYDLAVNGSGNGYTVTGSLPALSPAASVCYLSIQAAVGNSSTIVYKGGSDVKNDGTRQAKALAAGNVDVQQAVQYSVNLNQIYLAASGDGAVVNVEWHLG